MYDPNEAIENAEKKKKKEYKSAFPEGLIKRSESKAEDVWENEKMEEQSGSDNKSEIAEKWLEDPSPNQQPKTPKKFLTRKSKQIKP